MSLAPRVRKLVLTAHVASSVGWLGAVAGFLSLAVAGLMSQDSQLVRAVYLGMDLIARFVIVPLCLASLLTGLVQGLGTRWGLFQHYWVLTKLLITVLSTVVLLVHLRPIHSMASVAAERTVSGTDLQAQIQLVVADGAALLAPLVTTTLPVYKPRGLTSYGRRMRRARRAVAAR